jgi:hypothetical protein
MLGREPAIKGAESPDEDDEALRGAGLPRDSVGGPGSSGSGEGVALDRLGGSPGVIWACGMLSPSLAVARRIRGRSGSSPLPEEDEPEEGLDAALPIVLDVLSPSLEAALCSRGRSGSLSSGLLARDTDPDPSTGCDASARSSAVPCLNCVTFTAR